MRHGLPPAGRLMQWLAAVSGMRTAPVRMALWGALLLACASALAPAAASELEQRMAMAGTTVDYELVLPDHYDPQHTYPAVLAFGGGPQNIDMVDAVVRRYLRSEAEKRGYIVVAPAAPDGQLFFEGGERIFPEFLQRILAHYHVEGGRFHIAGPSNGGISAFYIASLYPQYFWSVTAFPGFLPDASAARVHALRALCIHMFVGQLDPLGWQPMMQSQAAAFRAAGMSATYTVEAGQPHRIETLAGEHAGRLFDLFDAARHGCGH